MKPALAGLGLVPAAVNVEIPYAARQLGDDGRFSPTELQEKAVIAMTTELVALATALRPLQRRS